MIEGTANIKVAVDTSIEKIVADGIWEGRNVPEKAVGTDTRKCASSGQKASQVSKEGKSVISSTLLLQEVM